MSTQDKYLYRDSRNINSEEERYTLKLKVIPNQTYSLTITKPEEYKDRYVYLRDVKLNITQELNVGQRINFSSNTNAKEYELIVTKYENEKNSSEGKKENVIYLLQNYPNPFNPVTTLRYTLPEKMYVSIRVCNALGKEVKEMVNGNQEKGYYEVSFDGRELPSGIYFCRMTTEKFTNVIKMLLIK